MNPISDLSVRALCGAPGTLCAFVLLLVSAAPVAAQSNLTVTFDAPSDYTPGASSTWTVTIDNAGGADDDGGVTVTTMFPAGASVTGATCVLNGSSCDATISGGELATQSTALPAGESIELTLSVDVDADVTDDPLMAQATVAATDDSGATVDASADLALESDLSVAKTTSLLEYVPGGSGAYTVVVSNDGPSDASGVTLVDTAPAGMTIGNWTCTASDNATCPTSGSGNLDETFDLPAGESLTFDLPVSYASGATADPLINEASLTVPSSIEDPTPGDQSNSASLPRANADLSVTFPGGNPGAYVPGSTYESTPAANLVTIEVTNGGPSDVSGAPLTLTLPSEVIATGTDWQCSPASACSPASGSGDVSTNVALDALASVEIQLQPDYDSSALTDPLTLTASIGAGDKPDDDTANNSADLDLDIDRRADIEVTKTDGLSLVSPGDSFVYSIAVTNNGPSDVGQGSADIGILLDDTFPADLLGDPGVCSGDPAAPCAFVCPSDGGVAGSYDPNSCPSDVEVVELTGNIQDQPLSLAAGSTTTILAYVRVSGTAADGSEIRNTASVSIAATDPVTELSPGTGGSATDTTQVEISTDLVVTKTDGVTAAVAGELHSYTVVVENDGNQAADGVTVFDELPLYSGGSPAGFVPGSLEWQCSAFDNACCISGSSQCGLSAPTAPASADILDQQVDLPGQSRVEFTITGRIDPRATGTLANTATATLPDGVAESDPSDNSATDDDTQLTADAALSITKVLEDIEPVGIDIDPEAQGPPWLLTYRIEVANAGPSVARDVDVRDPLLDPLLESATARWNCSILADPDGFTTCESGTGALVATVDLGVDARIAFDLEVETTDQALGTITNTASADSASVTVESSLLGEADLKITKSGLSQATPGEDYNYTITVTNLGDDPVFGATVSDEFPPELANVAWTCEATTPVPGDLEPLGLAGPADGAGERVAISADGRHVYQVQPDVDAVLVYQRNNVPGLGFGSVAALETERNDENDGGDAGTTVENMVNPIDIVLSPDGRHVYVLSAAPSSSTAENAIVVFSRSSESAAADFGQLSYAGAVTDGVPGDPRRLAVTNDNVYASGDSGAIAVYSRNGSTGIPALIETQTADVPTAPGPMAIDHADGWLIVASTTVAEVAWFEINDDDSMGTPIGALSLLTNSTDADLASAEDLVLVPDADDLYVAAAGNLAAWRYRDDNGDGVPEPDETQNVALAGLTGVDVAADGEHVLAVARGSNQLTRLRRDIVSGELRERADRTGDPGLSAPEDLVVTPDGRHVLVASAAGGSGNRPLIVYSRRAPDPLFAFIENDRDGEGGITGLVSPSDVAISPDGRNVYAVNLGSGALVEFDRDPDVTDGGLHLTHRTTRFNGTGGITGMSAPEHVLVSPLDRSVIVSSEASDSIAIFDRATDGTLTFRQAFFDGVDGVDGLAGARGLAMDSTATHLYVAGGFDAAIAVFRRQSDGAFEYVGRIDNSSGGVSGLGGVRDVVVSADDRQVFAVSQEDDRLVVFDRETSIVDPDFGLLTFRQEAAIGVGDQPMAVSVSPDGDHVYVAAQITDSIGVFRRVTDPASSAFGSVVFAQQVQNLSDGVSFMDGPRDVEVSADGKRVYVAAQFDSSVLVFDRDQNAGSDNYGGLSLVEVRRDEVDGVQGLDNGYALAVSPNSRNVYYAGFDDRAIASFVLGIGSVCTGGGSGAIDDSVTIGNGGFLVYRVSANVRADASGSMTNTASVATPERVNDPNTNNNSSTLVTDLVPRADLELTKTNSQVSVVAGETVTYEIRVTNTGPSNLASSAGVPVAVSDLFDANPDFEPGSVTWSCVASGSGALDFVDAVIDAPPVEGDPDPDLGLAGVADVAVVPDPDGAGPLPPMLVAASVVDDSVALFERDPVDGALTHRLRVRDGETLAGDPVVDLAGASAVAAGPDGRFIYVASRVDDALSVFAVVDDGGAPALELTQTLTGVVGLNQAVDLILSSDGRFVYVAGANDDALAVFERETDPLSAGYGQLTWLESERNGFDDVGDIGGVVTGLDGPEALVTSPDGAHLYAVSATAAAVVRFDIAADGRLEFAGSQTASALDVDLAGAAAAVIGPLGRHLYVASSAADRILVLGRNADPLSGDFGRLAKIEEVVQGSGGVTGLLSPRGLAISGDGLHVYAAGQVSDAVTWFLRDPVAGTLNFGGVLSNRSSFVDGLDGVSALVLDETDARLYAAGTLQAAISRFERSSDSVCPVSGVGELDAIPVDIAAGGSVTFQVDAVVAADADGQLSNEAFVETPAGTDENPDNDSMTDADVVEVEADLRISKDDGRAEFDGLEGARALAGTEDSLYVAGPDDDGLGVFTRVDAPGTAEHGRLDFVDALRNGADGVSGLTDVAALAVSTDEAHVYAVSPTDNSLVVFARDPLTARLAFVESEASGVLGVTGLGGAGDVALSPDDEHVYVAGRLDNTVAVFDRQADDLSADYGRLTFLGQEQNGTDGVTGLVEPGALTVAPDGRHVYAVSGVDDSVVVFQRNINAGSASFGELSFVASYTDGGGIAGLAGAADVAVSPDGAFVHVLGAAGGTLALFQRNATNGELAFVEFKQDGTAGTTGLAGASRVRFSADGSHLYVAGRGADSIIRFDVAGDGSLEFGATVADGDPAPATGGEVIGLDGVADVWLPDDGDHLYSAAAEADAVATFAREQAADPAANTGALDYRDVVIDGLGGVAPGDIVTYRIIVENLGPSDVISAHVVDDFPETFSAVNWSCTPSASPAASCAPGGTGSIDDDSVSLEVGARVTYLADAVVRDDASGRVVNTATVTGIGVQDPVIANNTATDDDTVLSPRVDLVVDVDDGRTEAVPGEALTYDIEIRNIGPSLARDVTVTDAVPPALFDVAWTCTAAPVEGLLSPVDQATTLDAVGALAIAGSGRFAYAAGNIGGAAAIAVFQRDSVSGSLGTVLATYRDGEDGFEGIEGASDWALSADERFLFLAAETADAVAVFERDAGSGLLTPAGVYRDGVGGIDGLGGVRDLLFDPALNVLYAAGTLDDAIASFAVDPTTGALAFVDRIGQSDAGVDGLNGVIAMAFDQGYLLAVAADNDSLAAFERSPSDGTLTPAALVQNFEFGPPDPAPVLDQPSAIRIAGERVVVAAEGGNAVSAFRFDPAEPGFELDWTIESGVGGISGLEGPVALAFAERQQRLYVASALTERIHLFSLRDVSPSLVAEYGTAELSALTGLAGLALPPEGGPLYAFADPGAIGAFSRQRGSLCPLSGRDELRSHAVEIVPDGTLTYALTGTVFPNATGTLAYTVEAGSRFAERELNPADNSDDDIDTLVPAPDLSTTKSDGLTEVVAGTAIDWDIDFANAGVSDAVGARLLDAVPTWPTDPGVAAGSAAWSCTTNAPLVGAAGLIDPELGGLTTLRVTAGGRRVLAADPTGDRLVVLDRDAGGGLAVDRIVADGMSLNGTPVAGLAGASSAVETADGRFLYVAGRDANSVVAFERSEAGFVWLQRVESGTNAVSGLIGAEFVVLSPDERYVFVASPASDAIVVLRRGEDGRLSFVERVRDGFGTIEPDSDVIRGVRALHVSARGDRLYAVAPGSSSVASFAIDDATGSLTYLGVLRDGEDGVSGLADPQHLVAAPGDAQIHVVDRAGGRLTVLAPDADGVLEFVTSIAGFSDPVAAAMDPEGRRLYVLDAGGAIALLARDWASGALESRGVLDPGGAVPANGAALAYAPAPDGLLVAAPAASELSAFEERALSRCLAASGSGETIDVGVDLGVGGSGSIALSATVHPAARGELVNSAALMPVDGADPASGNDVGTDSTTVIAVSDLAVTKTGPAEAVAGTDVSYEITVTNAGPSDALGIGVTDSAPAPLTAMSWTCTATAGSSCPAGGSGAPDFFATVRVGGELTVTLTGTIDPGFIGQMTNSVVLTPEPGATDPTPGDHSDAVETEVRAEADVAATKTTLTAPVVAGQPIAYRIDIVNDGPSDAPDVAIADTLPALLTGASWTCTGTSGAGCPPSGTGAPAFDASLPAGSAIEIRIDGAVPATATGTAINTVTATVQAPVTDPDTRNNGARVDDPIVVRSDVSVALVAPLNPFDPAAFGDLPLTVEVTNAGPSMARDIEVLLDLSSSVRQTRPGCTRPTPTQVRCLISQLLPGNSRTLELAFDQLPSAPATLVVDGVVTTRSDDLVPSNDTDSVTVDLVNGADLAVTIDNGTTWLSPDETFDYTVTVNNFGSRTVFGATVDVIPDIELLDVEWNCAATGGAVCTASGSGPISDLVDVPSGGVLTYTLTARVDPAVDLTVPVSVTTEAAVSSTPPPVELIAVNNLDVDDDEVRLTMFEDGFESVFGTARTLRAPLTCLEAELSASTERLAPAGRRIEAVFADQRLLFWLDVSHRRAHSWLRLVARDESAVDGSDWLSWPAADTLTLRIDHGRARIDAGAETLWQSELELPDIERTWLQRGAVVRRAVCAEPGGAD